MEKEFNECGKIIEEGKYYEVYVSDGYLEACSKKCAKKIHSRDFQNSIEEKDIY